MLLVCVVHHGGCACEKPVCNCIRWFADVVLFITGYFVVSYPNSYTFNIYADDGALLYFEGQPAPIVSGATNQAACESAWPPSNG